MDKKYKLVRDEMELAYGTSLESLEKLANLFSEDGVVFIKRGDVILRTYRNQKWEGIKETPMKDTAEWDRNEDTAKQSKEVIPPKKAIMIRRKSAVP